MEQETKMQCTNVDWNGQRADLQNRITNYLKRFGLLNEELEPVKGKIDTTTWLCGPPTSKGQFQQYPSRFVYNLKKTYPELVNDGVLHMFAGGADFGTTTDYRPETGADIIAPFDEIPTPLIPYTGVIADPPYADHWQGQWHGDLPKPKHILRVASRLVASGGLIAILHIIIIPAYKEFGVERIALHPILTGPNNAIRVLNVFRRTS